MSNQKHETGHKKRRKASEPKTLPTNPDGYARELVKRGLASPQILTYTRRPEQ